MDSKCQGFMMKSLFNKINWDKISYVGFDMDGTLYDEYEFISEVYKEISKLLKPESISFMKALGLFLIILFFLLSPEKV